MLSVLVVGGGGWAGARSLVGLGASRRSPIVVVALGGAAIEGLKTGDTMDVSAPIYTRTKPYYEVDFESMRLLSVIPPHVSCYVLS